MLFMHNEELKKKLRKEEGLAIFSRYPIVASNHRLLFRFVEGGRGRGEGGGREGGEREGGRGEEGGRRREEGGREGRSQPFVLLFLQERL
jgi:hypothetical protein